MGFTITKDNITHVPQLFQDRDTQEFVTKFLEELEQGKPNAYIDKTSEEMLALLACRAAVKAGDKLDSKAMEKILEELEHTPNYATCPHGKPTKIIINIHDIHAMFKRV